MTISRVLSSPTSIFGFTCQPGDLILVGQMNISTAVAPDAIPGYTVVDFGTQGTSGVRWSYRIAEGSEDRVYATTPANTTNLNVQIFRSTLGFLALGANAATKGTGVTATIPALTLEKTDGTSWVSVEVFARTSTQAQMAGAITGTTMHLNNTRYALHSTNGGVSSWTAKTKTGFASEAWHAWTAEVKEGPPPSAVTGDQTLPAPTQTSSVAVTTAATGAQTLPKPTQTSDIDVAATVTGSQLLAKPSQTSEIIVPNGLPRNISGAQTLAKPSQTSAISTWPPRAVTGAQTLAKPSQTSSIIVQPNEVNISGNQLLPVPLNLASISAPNGARRVLVGNLPSGAKGLRISQAGYDSGSHPVDDERLIFSSEWPEVIPIHQVGSFTHRTQAQQGQVVTQLINFTGLGYVPFVTFIVKGNGDALPAGSDLYPSNRYYERKGLNIGIYYWMVLNPNTGDTQGYLRLNVSATQIRAESFVRELSPSSQGLPRTWTIYYVVYRKRAF